MVTVMNPADEIQTLENFPVTVCEMDQRKDGERWKWRVMFKGSNNSPGEESLLREGTKGKKAFRK